MAFPAIIAGALRALAASGVRAAGAATARGAAAAATRGAATLGTRVAVPQVMTAAAAQAAPATIASTQASAFSRFLASQQAAQAAPVASIPASVGGTSGQPTPGQSRRKRRNGDDDEENAVSPYQHVQRFSQSLTTARDAIDRFANSATRSAESLRTFDADASNQAAMVDRGRLIREFERGAVVGPWAAASARAGERFEQRAAPIKNLLEMIGNVISTATSQAFDLTIQKLRLDQIANKAIEWLNRLPGLKINPPNPNPGGHVLPWLNMLNQLAALQPLGGPPPLFVPPINPRP